MSGTQELPVITTTELLATDPAARAAIEGVAEPIAQQAGQTAALAAVQPVLAQTEDARDQAQAAADTVGNLVANAGVTAASYAGLVTAMSPLQEGSQGAVYTIGAEEGVYRVLSGLLTRTGDTQRQIEARGRATDATVAPVVAAVRTGPRYGLVSQVTLDADGRAVTADSEPGGRLLRDAAGMLTRESALLSSNASSLAALTAQSGAPGPSYGLLREAVLDADKRLVSATRQDAVALVRSPTGAVVTLGAVSVPATPVYSWRSLPGMIMPDTGIHVGIARFGQSFAGYVMDNIADAAPYTTTPMANALMPSEGLLPGDRAFSTYAGLVDQKSPTGFSTSCTACTEAARTIQAIWEASFPAVPQPPLVFTAHSEGGQPIQKFMPGSPNYVVLLRQIRRCFLASAAMGKRYICYVVEYLQGESNRTGGFFSTRAEFARYLAMLQMWLEIDIRAITGQTEPVRLVTTSIARDSLPAYISLAAVDAALADPARISCAWPNYAAEGLSHPVVAGYRRIDYALGKEIAHAVLGMSRRMMRILRWWEHSPTEIRCEIDVEAGASLVLDTSGDLIGMTGMDAGLGFSAYDKTGNLAIASVAVITPADIHPTRGNAMGLAITLATTPHAGSLRIYYANDSTLIGGGLGGSVSGPRGCVRLDNGVTLPDLVLPTHDFLMPAELI